jgi:poly-gamma-glutamate system protein
MLLSSFLSIGVLIIENYLSRADMREIEYRSEMIDAAEFMSKSMEEVRAGRLQEGLRIDPLYDPNLTGLIGSEYTSITTTLGDLEAKRTTTNPNLAALLVLLLKNAGVQNGDTIAIGASGSFPALILAALSAAKAMNLHPIAICSLTSSMWGANDLEYTWLDMYRYARKVLEYKIAALSIGGYRDIGANLNQESVGILEQKIEASGIRYIYEPDFRTNVGMRMRIYASAAELTKIAAFINIGGNEVNVGRSATMLKLLPGLTEISEYPPAAEQGIIYEFAEEKTPIIHLLNIKALILRYGLPWDPVPIPEIGEGGVYYHRQNKRMKIILIPLNAVYFCLLGFIFLIFGRNRHCWLIARTRK